MILFVGDCHGDFEPMLEAGAGATTVILLGDQEPLDDLASILGPDIAAKTWWIFGNHDSDDPEYLAHHASMADRNLHCRVVEIDGLRIAGLGGSFRSNVLGVDRQTTLNDLPQVRPQDTRQSLTLIRKDKKLAPQDHTTIFPEDLNFMARLASKIRIDVLVTHEAPESHKLGYRILGDVARALKTRIHVHAHHHERYDAMIEGGVGCRGRDVGHDDQMAAAKGWALLACRLSRRQHGSNGIRPEKKDVPRRVHRLGRVQKFYCARPERLAGRRCPDSCNLLE